MESLLSVAEELPGLYRDVLDAIAELERHGARTAAGRFRAQAGDAYGRAWNEDARRQLEALLRNVRHEAAAVERPAHSSRLRPGRLLGR